MEPVREFDRPSASGRRGCVVPAAGSSSRSRVDFVAARPREKSRTERPAFGFADRFRGIAFAAFSCILVSAAVAAHRTGGAELAVAQVDREIRWATTARPAWVWLSEEGSDFSAVLRDFYAGRGFAPGWIQGSGALARADRLTAILSRANEHGLKPGDYHVDRIRALLVRCRKDVAGSAPRDLAELDVLLSAEFLRYAWHQRFGPSNPVWSTVSWSERCRRTGLLRSLESAMGRGGPETGIRRWLALHGRPEGCNRWAALPPRAPMHVPYGKAWAGGGEWLGPRGPSGGWSRNHEA
jgi:hypothetical protein